MQTVETIVKELLELEPELRGKEKELRDAVKAMLDARPDARVDEKFLASLRERLMHKFSARTAHGEEKRYEPRTLPDDTKPWVLSLHHFLTRRAAFVPGLAILLVLASVAFIAPRTQRQPQVAVDTTGLGMEVRRVAAGGFGSLSAYSGAALGTAMNERVDVSAPMSAAAPMPSFAGGGVGYGGGGGGITQSASADAVSAKMIAPVEGMAIAPGEPYPYIPTIVSYAYKGDALELPETVDVLRRAKGAGAGAASLLSLLPADMNAGKFSDLRVQSFSGFEDRAYGLSVYADLYEETLSLSKYYPRWPHPESECGGDQRCYEALRVRESEMPSDDEAIRMASAFLSQRGISTDGYGAPTANKPWYRWYASLAAEARSAFYLPESVMVTWPLRADGADVVDDSGSPFGMTVNVNVREKRGEGAYNIMTRRYDASSYAGVTDEKTVIAAAENGMQGRYEIEGQVKRVTATLGTPDRVLLRMWQNGGDGTGRELLVPALRFPVTDNGGAEANDVQPYIVVPLAKELFEQRSGFGVPMPVPMPYADPMPVDIGSGAATSGPAGSALDSTVSSPPMMR